MFFLINLFNLINKFLYNLNLFKIYFLLHFLKTNFLFKKIMESIQRFVTKQYTDLLQKRSSQRLKPFSIDSNNFFIKENDDDDDEYNNFDYNNNKKLNKIIKQQQKTRFLSFKSKNLSDELLPLKYFESNNTLLAHINDETIDNYYNYKINNAKKWLINFYFDFNL